MILKDQLQREINLPGIPQRIVSLVPSQTELLVSLSLEEKLKGVTKFCVHPQRIRKSSKVVGGTKKVHYEKIRALNPDIILCNKEENTKEMVRELERIAPVHVSDVVDFEDALELIEQYGILFGVTDQAGQLLRNLIKAREEFQRKVFPGRKVAYLIWRKPWMAAAGDTFINSLLSLNRWENVLENKDNKDSRYPEIELSELAALKPDIILLSSEPFPFGEKHISEIAHQIKAKAILVDGEYFSWYGSRLLPAFEYFNELQKSLAKS